MKRGGRECSASLGLGSATPSWSFPESCACRSASNTTVGSESSSTVLGSGAAAEITGEQGVWRGAESMSVVSSSPTSSSSGDGALCRSAWPPGSVSRIVDADASGESIAPDGGLPFFTRGPAATLSSSSCSKRDTSPAGSIALASSGTLPSGTQSRIPSRHTMVDREMSPVRQSSISSRWDISRSLPHTFACHDRTSGELPRCWSLRLFDIDEIG